MNLVISSHGEEVSLMPSALQAAVDAVPSHDLSFTRALKLDGEVVANVGIIERWGGVARVWAWIEPEAKAHALSLTRLCKKELLYFERYFKRIEVEIPVDDAVGIAWIEVLGFHREAKMKCYGLGGEGDYYLYARFRNGSI